MGLRGVWPPFLEIGRKSAFFALFWSAANGGLRDGGLSKSEETWGKRPFSSVFWICQVSFASSGKERKRQKTGEKGRFRPISGKGGSSPLKPPFVTPPFAAPQFFGRVLVGEAFALTVRACLLTVMNLGLQSLNRWHAKGGTSKKAPLKHFLDL